MESKIQSKLSKLKKKHPEIVNFGIFFCPISKGFLIMSGTMCFYSKKLKSEVGSHSLVSWPCTKSLAWNWPRSVAFWPSTCKMEPSRKAKTGGTPGISWYCTIRSSLVSPLCVELGSWNVIKNIRKKGHHLNSFAKLYVSNLEFWSKNFKNLVLDRNSMISGLLTIIEFFKSPKPDDHRIHPKFFMAKR